MNYLRSIAKILRPWRTIKRQEKELERIRKILSDPYVSGIEIGSQGITVNSSGTVVSLLAGTFVGLLESDPRIVNYLEITFSSPKGPILVTVFKPNGLTPSDLQKKAEQRAKELESALTLVVRAYDACEGVSVGEWADTLDHAIEPAKSLLKG